MKNGVKHTLSQAGRKGRAIEPKTRHEAVAVMVSQLTCLALFGISERWYLDFVRGRAVAHARVGKMVLVDVGVFRAALAAASTGGGDAPDTSIEPSAPANDLATADGVLAALGYRRIAGGAR